RILKRCGEPPWQGIPNVGWLTPISVLSFSNKERLTRALLNTGRPCKCNPTRGMTNTILVRHFWNKLRWTKRSLSVKGRCACGPLTQLVVLVLATSFLEFG